MIRKRSIELLIMASGLIVTCALAKSVTSTKHRSLPINCSVLPSTVLSNVLGSAFNSRYMSITKPQNTADEDIVQPLAVDHHEHSVRPVKRKTKSLHPFYVDNTYVSELSDRPAWEVENFDAMMGKIRGRRAAETPTHERGKREGFGPFGDPTLLLNGERPWICESTVKWTDLGKDYFPRYLRNVVCTKKACWYGHFVCTPRSFTVRILRRRTDQCANSGPVYKNGVVGLPGDLRELWVWEERAVNFCCDCEIN